MSKTYLLGSVDLSTTGRDTGRVIDDVVLVELRSLSLELLLVRAAGSDLVFGLGVDVGVLNGLVLNGDLLFLGRHCVSESS